MQAILTQKFYEFLRDHYPDVLLRLQEQNKVTAYLVSGIASVDDLLNRLLAEEKPVTVIEEICLLELKKALGPSRYEYVKEILYAEFVPQAQQLAGAGILATELVNLVTWCNPYFDEAGFSFDNEDNHYLRYLIIGAVDEYIYKN